MKTSTIGSLWNDLLRKMAWICCILLLLFPLSMLAQQPAASLSQVRNGTASNPISPGNWVNGNVGAQQGHYVEGNSIPYRVVMTDLEPGTLVELEIEYDITHSYKHAIDFITTYNNLEPHLSVLGHDPEDIYPTIDYETLWPAGTAPEDQALIPTPNSTGSPVAGEPAATFDAQPDSLKQMSLWGGTFAAVDPVEYILQGDLTGQNSATSVMIRFTPAMSTAILSWGGHIAKQDTWGVGNSAVDINGSPYHTRLLDWNLNNLGNQDRSLNADAVTDIPACDFSGPAFLCSDTEGIYSADSLSPDWTYSWTIDPNGTNAYFVGDSTGSTVTINSGDQAGSFTVNLTVSQLFQGVMVTNTCSQVVNVAAGPSCSITGPSVVCPGGSAIFSGPSATAVNSASNASRSLILPTVITSYSWSITGDGTINGPTDQQTVTVDADLTCPGSYTLTLTVTDDQGCSSTCSMTVSVDDDQAPVISGVGADETIDCQMTPVFSDPTATDDCDDDPTLTYEDITTPGSCPQEYSITRTWTATDDCGNTATASQTITVEDNTAPVITGVDPDTTIYCADPMVFSDPVATDDCDPNPVITFNDVTTPGNCPQEYSVTRTWTATDACGNSSTAAQTINVVDDTAPVITGVGPDTTIVCPDTPEFPVASATDQCDRNPSLSYVTDTIPGSCPDEYTLIRTWTAEDDCGNISTATQTIIRLPNPEPEILGYEGLESGTIIDTITGDCEGVTIPFPEINTPCGPADVYYERSDGGLWSDPYMPGTTTEVCYWGVNPCGFSTDTLCLLVTVDECPDFFCSLTQGFYGNPGGMYCDSLTTEQLLDSLLAEGNLVVGSNGNTMTFYAGDAQCIMDLLPGGGPAKTISGANDCVSHPGIQIKQGEIFNILLAQTITLGLNLRLDDNLGSLEISSDTLVTAPSSGCIGEGDTIAGDWTKYAFPLDVYNELTQNGTVTATVSDLFDLANDALGGQPVSSSLGSIAQAVDLFNVAFDECRFGYFQVEPQTANAPAGPIVGEDLSNGNLDVDMAVYPNPFRNSTKIEFTSQADQRISMEVYSLTGVKVAGLFEANVEAGRTYTIHYNGEDNIRQATYILLIRSENGVKYQRIMMIR